MGLRRRGRNVAAAGVIALLLAACAPAAVETDAPPPSRTPAEIAAILPTADRFAVPTLPAAPTPADEGARVYTLYCMACHGDRGQGLTEEFRNAWGLEEANCWQSKCHAANHPPDGFTFPKYAPPLIGENTLLRFRTVLELYDYVSVNMPYHAPGALAPEQNWALTAFLGREHGVDVGAQPLETRRAARLLLHPDAQSAPAPGAPLYVWGTLVLLVIGGGLAMVAYRRANDSAAT